MRILPLIFSVLLLSAPFVQAADQDASPTVKEKTSQVWQATSEKASEYGDIAADKSKKAWEITKEKSKDIAHKTAKKASEYGDIAADKSKETGEVVWKKMKEVGSKTADAAREGAQKIRSAAGE